MGGMLSVQSVRGAGATFQFTIRAPVADSAQLGAQRGDAGAYEAQQRARRLLAGPVLDGGGYAHLDTPLSATDLALLTPALRDQLKVALQELNLARVAVLLQALPPALQAVVERIEYMVRLHQYPQLCILLDQAGNVLETRA